jgi:hypothetical protein
MEIQKMLYWIGINLLAIFCIVKESTNAQPNCVQFNPIYENLLRNLQTSFNELQGSFGYQNVSNYEKLKKRLEKIFDIVNKTEIKQTGISFEKQKALYDWLKANIEEQAGGLPRWHFMSLAWNNGCQGLPHAIFIDGYFNRYLPAEAESNNNYASKNMGIRDHVWLDAYASDGCLKTLIENQINVRKSSGQSTSRLEHLLKNLNDRNTLSCSLHGLREEGDKEYPELMKDINICMMKKMENRLIKFLEQLC